MSLDKPRDQVDFWQEFWNFGSISTIASLIRESPFAYQQCGLQPHCVYKQCGLCCTPAFISEFRILVHVHRGYLQVQLLLKHLILSMSFPGLKHCTHVAAFSFLWKEYIHGRERERKEVSRWIPPDSTSLSLSHSLCLSLSISFFFLVIWLCIFITYENKPQLYAETMSSSKSPGMAVVLVTPSSQTEIFIKEIENIKKN